MRPISLFILACLGSAAAQEQPNEYQCAWTSEKITIDGAADEKAWEAATLIEDFAMTWLKDGLKPERSTKARLLWDRDFLYFHAEMEDGDLYADIDEDDGDLWLNDVFELFFKPSKNHGGYYEFQVNPTGAVLDCFFPRRNAGGLARFIGDQDFHIDAEVKLNGTLNDWTDQDEGWSVEGRIPWTDFHRSGGRPAADEVWTFHLARYDYSVDLKNGVDSSSSAPLTKYNFHFWEDYEPIRFVGPTDEQALKLPAQLNEVGPVLTSRVKGMPTPPPIYKTERVFEEADISMLITMEYDSDSNSLFIGDRPQGFKSGCLKRMDLETSEVDVLLDEDEYVIYDIALHPNFPTNGFIFLGRNGPGDVPRHERSSEVVRYTIDPENGELDPGSLLRVIGWTSGGHDGAAVEFGENGLLYVTSGDGSNDSDTDNQGQGLDHLRAKVLRINVDKPGENAPYSIPADNPFVDVSGARPETWAYGFRNPWRMNYDAETGQLWVGNNGQDWLEQVYLVERGANYGWSIFEGSKEFRPTRKRGPTPISGPTLEHHHQESRSLTGGVVYRGSKLAKIDGAYVYGDYSTGKIWGAKHDGEKVTWNEEIADTTLAITDFEQLRGGRLLVADHRSKGGIYELVPNDAEDTSAAFPKNLSETGLFESVADHKVKPTLLPYSVNTPHWMDGAEAARYLILPEDAGDKPFGFHMLNTWNLPSGTAFMQTLTARGKRIETRILAQHDNEWAGYSYRWNEAQTDAELVAAEGATESMDRWAPWRFPSRAECMTCHTRAAGFVLGFQTAQLNRDHDYGGFQANQLDVFERLGWLRTNWGTDAFAAEKQNIAVSTARAKEARDFKLVDELNEQRRREFGTRLQRGARGGTMLSRSPDRLPRMAHPADETADIETRARSYLAANCSHCHRGAGGGNSPFELTFGLDTKNLRIIDEPAVHGIPGMPADDVFVVSTQSKPAVLLTRVALRGPGQMPPLCTNTPDTVGTTVLAKWLESLSKPSE